MVLRRFGVLMLGIVLLGLGFGFAFITTFETDHFDLSNDYTGSYRSVVVESGNYNTPILFGHGGVWCFLAILVGTALVAGWVAIRFARIVRARLDGRPLR